VSRIERQRPLARGDFPEGEMAVATQGSQRAGRGKRLEVPAVEGGTGGEIRDTREGARGARGDEPLDARL
jgi:hypothetical protein